MLSALQPLCGVGDSVALERPSARGEGGGPPGQAGGGDPGGWGGDRDGGGASTSGRAAQPAPRMAVVPLSSALVDAVSEGLVNECKIDYRL